MPNRLIPYVKAVVHLLCLAPFLVLLNRWRTGAFEFEADPVASITHFTGDWTLWLLLVSLAVTPLRRLHPSLSNLIRFRRMLGLYAFFYASLHLSTYMFLFSGYDIPTAWAGLKHGHLSVLWNQWLMVWPGVVDDLKKRRFIQVGIFAWVLLLTLAVTSPNFMLRLLGGKNWQRLHRLVYVAATAGCFHYWWLVKVGVRTPMKDTIVLTILLLARVLWVILKQRRKPGVKPQSRAPMQAA
jgi:methionine sulfoxide reductase heme-binding subunit